MANIPKKFRPVSDATASLGANVSLALREMYPSNTAKRVANDIGAEERTVRNWLEGNAPQSTQLMKLFTAYGKRFAGFVLAPCGDWADQMRMEAELAQRMKDARAAMDELEQYLASDKAKRS